MNHKQISIQKVTYSYAGKGWQLYPASFSLKPGEIAGIIGPNGSGKSTLLRIAAGIIRPSTGKVIVAGKDMADMSRREIAASVGFLPQDTGGYLDYLVEEAVAMGRFPHLKGAGFLCPHDISVVERCLIETDTEAYRGRSINQLSGGERQRVMLASVLAQEPDLLLLDEPTSALDIHHQVKIFTLISELVQTGIGAAVVTHDLNMASLFSDRLLLMKQGKIICRGRPEEILNKDILHESYGEGIEIMRHPKNGRPMIFPASVSDGNKDRVYLPPC